METKSQAVKRRTGVFDVIIGSLAAFSGVLLVIMTFFITYAVIVRYFNGKPPVWTIEISEYILLLVTFLGAAWVLKEDEHVRIDVLYQRFSPRFKRILDIITGCLGIITCGYFLWFALNATHSLYVRNVVMVGMLPIPKYILAGVIPLGIFLTLLQFARVTIANFRRDEKL